MLEAARELAEVGAGLQITPNASRLFQRWQLSQSLWESGAEPTRLTVHRYSGEVLANDPDFDKHIRAKYGAPFVDMHRVDVQRALYDRAVELGVVFHLSERLESIDFDGPVVKTASGKSFAGDLVVGADGLWSKTRQIFLGSKDEPKPTGDLAYRILLTLEEAEDEDLKAWISNPQCHFWVGPGSHAVAYSIRGGNLFNLVLLCPDNLPPGVARQEGSVEEMKALFDDWDPVLRRFMSKVSKVDKWKLMHRAELPAWVNEMSNVVLIGDSCHPMLPYLAQGANSSLEDGAVLGTLLGKIESKSQLPQALAAYERLRKARGEAIVRETFAQQHDFHLPDGEKQQERDAVFKSQLGNGIPTVKFPSRWTCPEVQPWLYGYDAYQQVEDEIARRPFG